MTDKLDNNAERWEVFFVKEKNKNIAAKEVEKYLNIKEDGTVHSMHILMPGMLCGCDLEESRVHEILEDSEQKGLLCFSHELESINHNIKAWDEKIKMSIYLECDNEKR